MLPKRGKVAAEAVEPLASKSETNTLVFCSRDNKHHRLPDSLSEFLLQWIVSGLGQKKPIFLGFSIFEIESNLKGLL